MENLTFIGTLHVKSTPHHELAAILEQLAIQRLLVEILQDDIDSGSIENYPDEMVFVLGRAKENKIEVYGFDSPINVMAEEKTEADNKAAIEEQNVILEKYTRKDANRPEVNATLKTPLVISSIDRNKRHLREKEMLENIKNLLDSTKKTVIITGVGHLDFFQKHFPDADFPFRS